MEAGVILLLLSSLLGRSWTLSFYGDSISVMPLQKNSDGTLKVTFYHRQNGRSDCQNQTSFFCEGGTCSDFVQSEVLQMDWDDSDQGRWCQSEGLTTETVQPNRTTFTLRESGCCWMSNVEGKTSWTSRVDLDLGTRSDSLNLNSCPVSTTVPSLRIPQNCFTRIRLLAHDPDGDVVRCRFTSEASVPANFTLDQSACTLGNAGTVQSGVHVFELLLEDFPSSNISLTYSDGTSASRGTFNTNSPPLCSVMLQFSVEVLPPISTCVAGSMLPMFLSRTPSHGEMTVMLEKASMPDIDEHYLKLKDPSCSLVSNDTYIMGTMSFSTCGTTLEDKGDYIVFKNEIHSFERPTEVITRRKTVQIDFSCEFPKTVTISSYYNLHQSDYIFTESNFGSFGYTFEIFRDGNFTQKVASDAYPVQVKLMETIYMGIQANSELPSVSLFVESCKATPDENPKNSLFYYLIQNGCLKDETVKIHPSNQTSFNFELQAFKFNGEFDQVYITCSVILCEPGSPFSRCSQGCLSNPSRRRRRGLSKETTGHYITQGPLQFVDLAPPIPPKEEKSAGKPRMDPSAEGNPPTATPETSSSDRSWGIRNVFSVSFSTLVFAGGFAVSLILLAVVLYRFRRRRKSEDQNVLIDSDVDQ
uniref:ZP domain-containing protein n=1 Tax=Nothobranchius kadleci TaxID=1051664 RepID=A0A1A8BTX5_NOTKA